MNFFSLFKRNLFYKFKKKQNIDNQRFSRRNLDNLFHHYGSDKSNIFRHTGGHGHGYSKYYNKYLKDLKNKKLRILEIGSYAGASAAAFKKFFINSKIFCFDVNISNFTYSSKDIKVYGIDIKNFKKVEKTLKKIVTQNNNELFDLIIDDGSHNLSDILNTFKNLFKYLNKKGFYIIEDYMFPNFYEYNRDVKDIFVDKMISYLLKKKYFKSNIINKNDQIYFHKNIKRIYRERGRLKDSNICFIRKI